MAYAGRKYAAGRLQNAHKGTSEPRGEALKGQGVSEYPRTFFRWSIFTHSDSKDSFGIPPSRSLALGCLCACGSHELRDLRKTETAP